MAPSSPSDLNGSIISIDHEYVVGRVSHSGPLTTLHEGRWTLFDLPVTIASLDGLIRLQMTTRVQRRLMGNVLKVAGKVRGRHLPDIIDTAELSAANVCLVMRLPRGRLAVQHLAEHGPMRLDAALRVVRGVVRALETCREQGHPHRGPMVDRIWLDERGEPTLLGLGEVLYRRDITIMKGRRHIELMWHIPPEVYRDSGDAAEADDGRSSVLAGMGSERTRQLEESPQAEVYALGCLLYHLLNGHHPYFVTPSDTSDGVANTLSGIRLELAAAGAPVAGIIDRALSLEPEARHASARELLEELEAASGTAGRAQGPRSEHTDAHGSVELDDDARARLPGPAVSSLTAPDTNLSLRTSLLLWRVTAGALFAALIAWTFLDFRRPNTIVVTSTPPGLELVEVTGHLDTPRGRTPLVLRNRRLSDPIELRTVGPDGTPGQPVALQPTEFQDLGRCHRVDLVAELTPANRRGTADPEPPPETDPAAAPDRERQAPAAPE